MRSNLLIELSLRSVRLRRSLVSATWAALSISWLTRMAGRPSVWS